MSQHLGKCKEFDYRKSQNNLKLNTEEEISWRMTNFKLSNTLIIYKMAESKDWIIIQSRSFKNIYLLSLSCIIQKLLNQYSCTDPLLYAESISAWSNQSSVMCLVSSEPIKMFGGNIYLSIYLIIQLEIWILQSALSVNGNIYFYWNYSGSTIWGN